MIKISRGIILIIIGIIVSFPIAKGFQIFLPSTYSLILPLLGFGLLIAGAIFVIKERSHKVHREIVSDQSKFCGKCGNEISRKNTFCTKCGTESKG
jgi:ribosomal protein S27AE